MQIYRKLHLEKKRCDIKLCANCEVSTIKKSKGKLQEFAQIVPRLFLAILLSLVISVPLELKIFEQEINEIDPDFLEKDWHHASELYGCGKYADDCYKVFCRKS